MVGIKDSALIWVCFWALLCSVALLSPPSDQILSPEATGGCACVSIVSAQMDTQTDRQTGSGLRGQPQAQPRAAGAGFLILSSTVPGVKGCGEA